MLRLAFVAALPAAFIGCQKPEPLHCANDDCSDGGLVGPVCTQSSECSGDLPVCDTDNKICAQCFGEMTALCTGKTPACKNDRCAGCTQHVDCKQSNACLKDGSCAVDTQIAYVDPMGTDNMMCTEMMPCTKLSKALATKRPYVKLHGATQEGVTINDQNVTLLADPGATLARDASGPVLQIMGTSMVEIDDLQIIGTSGRDNTGILIPMNSNVTLSLKHAKISGNQNNGITSTGSSIILETTTISSNQGLGISSSGSSLTISRSEIYGNQGGGIASGMTPITFDITNSFIYRNGNSTNTFVGGIAVIPLVGSKSRFEFNTVVDNQIQNSSAFSGGVLCDIATFNGPNNIIARNSVANDPTRTNSNTAGLCTYPTSIIRQTVTALNFRSPDNSPYDYHINAGSSAISQATTPSMVTIDFDNESRPPNASDQGADQYKP